MGLAEDVQAAVTAVAAVEADVANQAPSDGDKVLAALTPVLVELGWVAPVETPAGEPTPAAVEGQ